MTVQRTTLQLIAGTDGAGAPLTSSAIQAPVGAQLAGAQLVSSDDAGGAWAGGTLRVVLEYTTAPADSATPPQPAAGATWSTLPGGTSPNVTADGTAVVGDGAGCIDLTPASFIRARTEVVAGGPPTSIVQTVNVKCDYDKG